jgi:intraflagellar transport protein 172
VYKLGNAWGDKKSICNKFHQSSPITSMTWPGSHPNEVVFGLAEGKVKIGQLRSNKPATLYTTDSYVVSLASAGGGTQANEGVAIVSGHLDGSIYKFVFDDSGVGPAHSKFAQHPCVPYSLAWGECTVAAGNDGTVIFYDGEGGVQESFDYSNDPKVKEFTGAVFNPTGDSCVLGNFDSFFIYNFNQRNNCWEEVDIRKIPNLYSVTSMAWKHDGSRLAIGSLCGVVDLYDACIRRYRYKGKFEFTYVSLSQVIVKRLSNGTRIVLKSHFGCEIIKIDVYQDRYLVAKTAASGTSSGTLLLGDLDTCKLSEVPWQSTGTEKFVFDNETACIVFQAGELSLIEYGKNDLLGSVRTEHISGHLLSVRINERPAALTEEQERFGEEAAPENKKVAYLLDLQTICVKDMYSQASTTIPHDSKIDWLELNSRANLLLFRDKRRQLLLYDVIEQSRKCMLNFCNYVQWVPMSDVVVAQNRQNLCVWYNIKSPDKVTIYQIRGDVEEIMRSPDDSKTEVIVDEGINTASYQLDESLITFGTAIDDKNYRRAMDILEGLQLTIETEAMWTALSQATLKAQELLIAERCFAALGNVSKARFLGDINKMVAEKGKALAMDGKEFWGVKAKMAMLRKDLRESERIYLDQGQTDEAIQMYQELHKYDDAIKVAEERGHPEAEEMKKNYYDYLLKSGQEELAAVQKERDGDYNAAVELYLKGNLPAKAAKVINDRNITGQNQLLDRVAGALSAAKMFDKAGEFYEKMDQMQRALDAYTRGHAYRRAVDLARRSFPEKVVRLEEAWGDYLVSQKQVDMAINHYIEANVHTKAIEAALNSRQWAKAVQLVEALDADTAKPYYRRLARHYQEARNYEEAERNFVRAGRPEDAVEMYTRANRWEAAHKVAMSYMTESEVGMLYISQAQRMEAQSKLKEAERLYLTVNEPDLAINMYKKQRKYDQMIRLVTTYRKDLLKETHLHLAQQLEMEGNLRDAEHHYAEAGEWLSAVNMYRSNDQWDEAIRVAKYHGGINASKRVAYAWALALGGEAGSKLLTKLGLIEPAIDYAIESGAFDHAFELARSCLTKKLPEVHLKHALFLEDEERFKEAEEEFVKANKPKEAIDMYIHQQDWANAMRVAEQCDPASVSDVFVAQARVLVERKEFQRAEGLFISASKPELALQAYQEARLWQDAMRVAKRYLPHKLSEVNMAYQRASTGEPGTKEEFVARARMWEDSRQWGQAIDAYLSVTQEQLADHDALVELWQAAVQLATQHERERINDVCNQAAGLLRGIQRFEPAAELYKDIDRIDEAVECYISGQVWNKARALCQSQAPALMQQVEKAYSASLMQSENADGLVEVGNVNDGLELFAKRGEWDKLFEVAQREGSESILTKYAMLYAGKLAQEGKWAQAVSAMHQYGTQPNQKHFDLFVEIAKAVLAFSLEEEENAADYVNTVRELRTVLFKVIGEIKQLTDSAPKELEQMLMATHYLHMRNVAINENLTDLATKITVALLKYCGAIPADKLFYLAGMLCKENERYTSLAFVLLNRYIDLTEAIEDGDTSMLDNADLADTCIPSPFDYDLPKKQFQTDEKREEVRDWVLAMSMDQQVEQSLPAKGEGDPMFEALYTHNNSICIVTGHPVPNSLYMDIETAAGNITANKQDWNKFVSATKQDPWTEKQATPKY